MNPGIAGPRDYLLPADDGAGALTAIRSRRRCAGDAPVNIRSRFHDTFDWALYHAGSALEERSSQPDGDHRELILQPLAMEHANPVAPAPSQRVTADPGFANELPPGPVRERVAPLLGVRRLLPVVDVTTEIETLRLLNDDDKTVARIQILHHRYSDPDIAGEGPLSARLRVLPVRGYADELVHAVELIEQELLLQPVERPLLLEALAATGRRPGGYSTRLDYRLDPDQRADAATKLILRDLLDTVEANVPGTKANLDTEFLHDLRVATRRTRSALSQIKGVFAEDVVADFKTRFAWLQQVTGPVRDLDVYLLDFPELQERLPVAMRADLEALKTFLVSHYDEEQRRLVAVLESTDFAALIRDWRAFLDAPEPHEPTAPNAAQPIKAVADARIRGMFKRVLKEGRGITDASPAEDLHELRKSCKKLRYLMEFFQSLYPKTEARELVKQTKVLLDNLGEFQDLAVQAQHLEQTALQMHREGAASVDTLLSMGALVSTMLAGQAQARDDFGRIFAGFDDAASHARFESMFGSKRKRGKGRAKKHEAKGV